MTTGLRTRRIRRRPRRTKTDSARTLSGGWGFNMWQECDLQSDETKSVRYSPAGASAALASGSITNRPVFSVMDAAEMMNANATEDDVFLALAKYVLAVSSAVGGRAVANVRKCSDQSKCQDVKNTQFVK